MIIKERPPLNLERGKTLADVAYEEMCSLIEGGSWPTRSKLPSETVLATRFGMSRPVIRQALSRLRDAGLIQSRQGSGSYVLGVEPSAEAAAPPVNFPSIGSVADLESFLNFREGIEGEAAAMAATRRSDRQMSDLAAASARLAEDHPLSQGPQDDFAFHLAVAEASGNPFYVNTLNSLREHLLLGMGLTWSFSRGGAEFKKVVVRQHDYIVAAIRKGDEGAARVAMREHLSWSRTRLLTGGLAAPIRIE